MKITIYPLFSTFLLGAITSILGLLPIASHAATLASNGSQADVQSKISGAVDGDTVTIPAGTFTWTSGVTISGKGIKLQGAGGGRVEGSSTTSLAIGTGSKSFAIRSGSTVTSSGFTAGEAIIVRNKHVAANTMTGTVTSWNGTTLVVNATSSTGSGTLNAWTFEMPSATQTTIVHSADSLTLIQVTRDVTNSTEITGLRLVRGTATTWNSYGISIGGTGKPILIHDIRISSVVLGINASGSGLIVWQCYFDIGFDIGNNTNAVNNGLQLRGESDSWTTAHSIGAADTTGIKNTYIENCYFIGHVLACIDASDNFRGSLRYCVLDNSGITIHGQDTGPIGMRHLEVYNNLMIFDALPAPSALTANMNYWISWRGGSGIWTDNVMDDITSWAWGNKGEVSLEYQPIRRGTTVYGANGWTLGYPSSRQPGQGINSGTTTTLNGVTIYTNRIVEGVYVWNNTGTCAIGVGNYNPDDVGLNRQIADYIKFNRDYFERAPTGAEPYVGYTKYTYPHPLRPGMPPSKAFVSINLN